MIAFRSTDQHTISSVWHKHKFAQVVKVGMHMFIAKNLFKAVHFGCLLSTFLFVTYSNSTIFSEITHVLLFQTTLKFSLVTYMCASLLTLGYHR